MRRSVLTAESLITHSPRFCSRGSLHVRVVVSIAAKKTEWAKLGLKTTKLQPRWNNPLINISLLSDLLAIYSLLISLSFCLSVQPKVRWRPWAILHWRSSNSLVSFLHHSAWIMPRAFKVQMTYSFWFGEKKAKSMIPSCLQALG